MGKAIGIDLGTTNSVACYFDGVRTLVLVNSQNEELTPSVVMSEPFAEEEPTNILVGRPAVNQARLSPEDAISSIKRLMGRPYSHEKVQQLKDTVAYRVVESTDPVRGQAAVMMGGKQYLPEDISAMVLTEIKKYSGHALGKEVTHAVITVPAYFGQPQIAATRNAGLKAGLVVKTVLPEPTAAALAFGAEIRLQGNRVLVFDLGGGTFDISIISVVDDNYQIIREYGDEFLGGDDLDNEIVKMILKHVQEKYGVDLSGDGRMRIVAKSEAEAAKKSLSNLTTNAAVISFEAARVGDKVINVRLRITREEFDNAIASYVKRCEMLVREALEKESLTPEHITDVLLVGGSTAVPAIYRSMEATFGKDKIRRNVNPMHCVAIGAAILAHRMLGVDCPQCGKLCDESLTVCPQCGASLAAAPAALQDIYIQDSTAQSYGVEVVSQTGDEKVFKVLVKKGTPVPMNEPTVETLYTTEDRQSLIKVPVFEGMGSSVEQNKPIGIVRYELPQGLPAHYPVKLEFRLSRDREIKLTIDVDGQRHEESLKHEFIGQLSEHSEEDNSSGNDDELINEPEQKLALLETYVEYGCEFLVAYERLLTANEKQKLQQLIDSAKAVVSNRDWQNADTWTRRLSTLMARCGSASVIAQALVAADNTADGGIAADLRLKAAQLKQAAEISDVASVSKLTDPIVSLVRQVHQNAREVGRIYAAKKFGGLLRER